MQNPYVSLLRTSWRYAQGYRKKLIFMYLALVFTNVLGAMNPLLLGWFVRSIQRDAGKILHFTLIYASCYFGIKIISWSLYGPMRVRERILAFGISGNFLQDRYHQILHLRPDWHQDHHSAESINRIRRAYDALRVFLERGVFYIVIIVRFSFSVAAVLYFSPIYGSIAIFLGGLSIFVIRRFDQPIVETLKGIDEAEHVFSAALSDSLSNIQTVITLRLEKAMEENLLVKLGKIFIPHRRNAILHEWKWFSSEMLIIAIYLVTIVGYAVQHRTPGRAFDIGVFIALIAYTGDFTNVFYDIAWQYADIIRFNTQVQSASTIADAYSKLHPSKSGMIMPANWQRIGIHGLNFAYRSNGGENRNSRSLHDLNFHIRRGQRIALVGASGSGKSTLLSLLRGLYMPEPGIEMRIDDHLQDFTVLHNAVTLVPQEPEIFDNTIAYNITLGLPFTEQQVLLACQGAQFLEVVQKLPKGLESDIREKGVNLSGGERQRLALARGIMAAMKSSLILLDEPTSSVDARTEAHIYEGLFEAFGGSTIISSVHRLHLLDRFDHIYVLHDGKIADQGTYRHLKERSAAFQYLWRHQKEGIA